MDVVDLYMASGDFHEAVRRSGLPIHVAHLKLLKSGCLKIQDKIRYGSKASKLGGKAEELFQQLVPEAIDANRNFQKNNPHYDFYLDGVTIDVKYSSMHLDKRYHSNNASWSVRATGDQDFIVAFLESEKGRELNNPLVLVIPMAFVDVKRTLTISRHSVWVKEFQVEPEELQVMLKEYVKLRKAGLF